jgi:hypothetical protein
MIYRDLICKKAEEREDGLGVWRGLLLAILFSAPIWLLVVMALILWFTLSGCATGPSWKGMCWAKSVYCATVVQNETRRDVPVRIAVRNVRPGVDHAQAQAYINGRWEWLQMDGEFVYVGGQEWAQFAPYKYVLQDDTPWVEAADRAQPAKP